MWKERCDMSIWTDSEECYIDMKNSLGVVSCDIWMRFFDFAITPLEMTKSYSENLILTDASFFYEFIEELLPQLSLIGVGMIHCYDSLIEKRKTDFFPDIFRDFTEMFSNMRVKNIERRSSRESDTDIFFWSQYF